MKPPSARAPDRSLGPLDRSITEIAAPWGNQIEDSRDFRVMGSNVRGINPEGTNAEEKLGLLRQLVAETQPNALCMAETNTAWQHIPAESRLGSKANEWWGTAHTKCAWYQSYPKTQSSWQPGGAAIVILGSYTSKVIDSGHDPTGLGRWAWVRLQGKNNKAITIISAYRPVENKDGPYSVWRQQYYKLTDGGKKNLEVNPCQQFVDDLIKQIKKFQRRGDKICLYLDANDSLLKKWSFTTAMEDLNLTDSVITRHGEQAPATTDNGKHPIDGLYWSAQVPVTASGYLAFVEKFSNHCPLFADVSSQYLFGHDSLPPTKAAARRLKCDDPRIVARYIRYYRAYLIKRGIFERIMLLEAAIGEGEMTRAQEREYEAIDKICNRGKLKAERQCRRLKVGNVAWSPAIEEAMSVHQLWSIVVQRMEGRKISLSRILRLAHKVGATVTSETTHDYAVAQRELSWKTYKDIKKEARSLRATWLEDLAIARAEAGLEHASHAIRTLKSREAIRRDFRRIKAATNPTAQRPLTLVQTICARTGTIIDHVTKTRIEQACLQENERRFRQSNGTPLQNPVAISLLGPDGCTDMATHILETGRIPKALLELDPFLGEYLAAHRVNDALPPVHFDLPTVAHIRGWQRAKERTSSSRSGIHFGHYIACARDPDLAAADAAMASIPWRTGYSPERWHQGINVMLEKKLGVWIVERLRTILLLEADFNQGNKQLGRAMMANAEKFGLLAVEQYGSRKSHTAIDQGLNKRLTYDISRQRRQRIAVVPTDCKGCYDRMAHIAAGLGMRRVGATIPQVKTMLATLQSLKHYVRTAFGDSVEYFDADNSSGIPIGGTCQGNGASPAIWALISTPIFDAMRRRGYGVFLRSPISGALLQFVGYAFVDDTDLCVSDPTSEYFESTSLFPLIQESVTFWEGFLRASGGALVPDKSHWYMVDYEWQADGSWTYVQEKPGDPILQVRDLDGILQTIERLPPNTGRRTVGIRLAPDGNNDDEFKYLSDTIDQWCEKIKASRLPKQLVWKALQTGILRKLAYPLPATTFTLAQCEELMSKLLKTALPHSQVNRHFPEVMRHAPLSACGFGIMHLYVEQGLQHLERLVTYGPKLNHITGNLINVTVEHLAFELGLPGCPFQHSYPIWRPLATPSWVAGIWDFLQHYQIGFKTAIPSIPLERAQDRFIMPFLAERGITCPTTLLASQRIRQFLQVIRLSDLFTVDGKRLRPTIWAGEAQPRRNTKTYSWPRQPKPIQDDWQLWQTALTSTLGVTHNNFRTTLQVGSWTSNWKSWEWFLSADDQWLIQANDQDFRLHVQYSRNSYHLTVHPTLSNWLQIRHFFPLRRADAQPNPVTEVVELQATDTHPVQWNSDYVLEFPRLSLDNFRCNKIREALQWAMQTSFDLLTDTAIADLVLSLSTHGVKAVSDGSSKDGRGSTAWILVSQATQVSGGYVVPGDHNHQDSYRSEMAGIFAILFLIRELTRLYHIPHPKVEIGCDNNGALMRLFLYSKQASMRDSHWDLVMLSKQLLDQMPTLQLNWRWIEGHQDNDLHDELLLDEWACWNILMDARAEYTRVQPQDPIIFPGYDKLWIPILTDTVMISNVPNQLREHCLGQPGREYWQERGFIGTVPIDSIHWDALGRALADTDETRRRWVTKHASGWCGVNKNLVRWKMRTNHHCPRCNQPQESANHVWQCQAITATTVWTAQMAELATWFDNQKTNTDLRDVILERLTAWRNNTPTIPYAGDFPGLRTALAAQDKATWSAAFMGRWTTDWADVQQVHFRFIKSKRSGRCWQVSLIKQLWSIAFKLWEDRNEINAKLVEEAEAIRLRTRIRFEYSKGCDLLHPTSRRLFNKPLEERLKQKNQILEAWLLNVTGARDRATTVATSASREETQAAKAARELQEQQEQARLLKKEAARALRATKEQARNLKQQKTRARERSIEKMGNNMASWLRSQDN